MRCMLIALLMLWLPHPANANPLTCRTIEDARQFSADNGMQLTWQGIVQGGAMVAEIWQTPEGSWLLSLVTPMGVSCLQLYGEGGQLVKVHEAHVP